MPQIPEGKVNLMKLPTKLLIATLTATAMLGVPVAVTAQATTASAVQAHTPNAAVQQTANATSTQILFENNSSHQIHFQVLIGEFVRIPERNLYIDPGKQVVAWGSASPLDVEVRFQQVGGWGSGEWWYASGETKNLYPLAPWLFATITTPNGDSYTLNQDDFQKTVIMRQADRYTVAMKSVNHSFDSGTKQVDYEITITD